MPYVTLPALVGAAIIFLVGLFATLLGFRRIGRQPGADFPREQRMDRARRLLRVFGPGLMIFAVVMLFLEPPPSPREWQTVTTADGVCSIDMPGTPTEREGPALKELGKPEVLQMLVQDRGAARYTLGCSEVTAANRDAPAEKLLETIGKNWLIAARHVGEPQLLRERNLSENGWPGKEIVIDMEDQRKQQKWFVVKNRLYRALAETPRDDKHLQEARRFLESLRMVK
ncbi:MAG TPA: hypothetical protein VH575_31430 [Gemmataceae bacterium]|jgi:hypothetical protein